MQATEQFTLSAGSTNRAAICACTLAIGLYAATCAPTVLWGDSATFAVRVARKELDSSLGLALAHPLYILMARAFAKIPIGDLAYRVNLFSGVCSALTVGLAARLVGRMCSSRVAMVVTVLSLAVGHTFWTHAVIAEVYSLYGLGLMIELTLLQKYLSGGGRGWLAGAVLANGLSTCNHLLAILHLPAYAMLMLWLVARGRVRVGHIAIIAACWICGASLYLGMIVGHFSAGEPLMGVIREALTGKNFAGDMGGRKFAALGQVARTAGAFALNFPTPAVLLAIPGIAALWRVGGSRAMLLFMLAICAVNLGFGFTYTVPDQYVFFFPCYCIIPILMGAGAGAWARTPGRAVACAMLAALPVLVYEIAPAADRRLEYGLTRVRALPGRDKYQYFLRPRKNGEAGAREFGTAALRTASPGGMLMADSTVQSLLVYLRDIEGVGRDVALTEGDVEPSPPTAPVSPRAVASFVAAGRCYLCDATPGYFAKWLTADYEFRRVGPILQVVRRSAATQAARGE